MKRKNQNLPQAIETEESLISSDTLPEFAELEEQYQKDLAEIQKEEAEKQAAEEKPKRGRKKKESSLEPSETSAVDTGEAIQVSPEDIEDWTSFPLDMFFTRSDKKPLNSIERKAWSRACAKLINKYASAVANKWNAEIGAVICLTTILAVRMKAPEIKEAEKPKEAPDMVFRNPETEKFQDHSFGLQTDPVKS